MDTEPDIRVYKNPGLPGTFSVSHDPLLVSTVQVSLRRLFSPNHLGL